MYSEYLLWRSGHQLNNSTLRKRLKIVNVYITTILLKATAENAHLELKNFRQKYVSGCRQKARNDLYFVYRVEKHEKDVQFKLS